MKNKINVGIVGATGYTGSELAAILINHPNVNISAITSDSKAGQKFSDIHSHFYGIIDKELIHSDNLPVNDLDVIFLALPHGVSMGFVKRYQSNSFKIIDLSGDFRLNSSESYEEWYGTEHIYKEGIKEAQYGIPELFAKEIESSKLIANPGCYPTSAILAISPLIKENLVDNSAIIIDSKSGVTGAGVKPGTVNHFCNVNDNFFAYKISNHRHTVEIEQVLGTIGNTNITVQFTPHLLPVDRGILSTTYLQPKTKISQEKLVELYNHNYANKKYIRIRNSSPHIKDVRGTNYCDIYPHHDERTDRIIVVSAIDNLVRGAAGQAVQNMNLMFGISEDTGLSQIPMRP